MSWSWMCQTPSALLPRNMAVLVAVVDCFWDLKDLIDAIPEVAFLAPHGLMVASHNFEVLFGGCFRFPCLLTCT